MDSVAFEHHLLSPQGRGHLPAHAATGVAGGAACGDVVSISLAGDGRRILDAGFSAGGCGATQAAGSAAVTLAAGREVLDVARLGAADVADELGGLSPAKMHAAELAADALHRALGAHVWARGAVEPVPGRSLVAMSGGVDSAVAALLSVRRGDVAAVTLELWADPASDGESSCCSARAVRDARSLAHRLGLSHITLDLREEFRSGVVEPFIDDHASGLTPNPCVRCNGHVRLDAMLALADRVGAERLVTGHYARVARHGAGGPMLRLAADPAKDQTYMLAALAPQTLDRLEFPLGELAKTEVRALAAQAELPVATKPDSQDLCFLAGTDRASFLRRHGGARERPGEIVDSGGRVLGRHRGHQAFTVGQRKGIGIAAEQPLYVLAKDASTNRVTVGIREELRAARVVVRGATLLRDAARVDRVKLRYRSRPLACRVAGRPAAGRHPRLELELSEPVEGAAPGQTACLMDGDLVVGHATIAAA